MTDHGSRLDRWRASGLLMPSVATVIALAILLSLGTWQLKRKAWKEGIVAKIAERVTAKPVSFEDLSPAALAGADIEYLHVTVTGRLHHDKEHYLYAPGQSGLAWQVLTPLEWKKDEIVWVNRGQVPDARRAPETRIQGQVAGAVTITGLVRRPHAGSFTPPNDLKRNIWHFADPGELTRASFAGLSVNPAPVIIEADASATPPDGLPAGGVTRLSIPNRHLEYAVTWFGLAATLIGVFLVFVRTRLRSP